MALLLISVLLMILKQSLKVAVLLGSVLTTEYGTVDKVRWANDAANPTASILVSNVQLVEFDSREEASKWIKASKLAVGAGGVRSGASSPVGAVDPLAIGEEYLETTTPLFYKATGLTNTGLDCFVSNPYNL